METNSHADARTSMDVPGSVEGTETSYDNTDTSSDIEWLGEYMRYFNISNDHLRCVIIGKTGTGKSTTLNSISGQKLFMSKRQPKAVTQTCQAETVNSLGRTLTLVDTPGMFDSETPLEDTKREIERCIELTLPGPHLVLFPIRADSRFSAEDRDTFNTFVDQFGIDIMQHTIILLTHYDSLNHSEDDVREFVAGVQNLIPLLETHENFMPFDNHLEGAEAAEQLNKLHNIIVCILQRNNGRCYTNEQYEARARLICDEKRKEEQRKKQEKEEELQRVREQERQKYLKYLATGTKIAADIIVPGSGMLIEATQLGHSWVKNDSSGMKEHAIGLALGGLFFVGGSVLGFTKEATTTYTSSTNLVNTAASTSVSSVSKAAVQNTAQVMATTTGKEVGSSMAKQVSKSVLKRTAVETSKDTTKNIVLEASKQATQSIAHVVGDNGSKTIVNLAARSAVRQSTDTVTQSVVTKGLLVVTETVAKSTIKESVKQTTATMAKSVIQDAGQTTIQNAVKITSAQLTKELSKTTTKRVTEELVGNGLLHVITPLGVVAKAVYKSHYNDDQRTSQQHTHTIKIKTSDVRIL